MQLCHVAATREQICQMTYASMRNPIHVSIMKEVLDI